MYDAKYSAQCLRPSPHFLRQFKYIHQWSKVSANGSVLDLGGGTGEYSLVLQKAGYHVTLNDISDIAIAKAVASGVQNTLAGNILDHQTNDAGPFDLVLARGFSPLNTDDRLAFQAVLAKIKRLTSDQGKIVIWGLTDMTGNWSESGWFNWHPRDLRELSGHTIAFPAFRYQCFLPLVINHIVSRIMEKLSLSRPITMITMCQT